MAILVHMNYCTFSFLLRDRSVLSEDCQLLPSLSSLSISLSSSSYASPLDATTTLTPKPPSLPSSLSLSPSTSLSKPQPYTSLSLPPFNTLFSNSPVSPPLTTLPLASLPSLLLQHRLPVMTTLITIIISNKYNYNAAYNEGDNDQK